MNCRPNLGHMQQKVDGTKNLSPFLGPAWPGPFTPPKQRFHSSTASPSFWHELSQFAVFLLQSPCSSCCLTRYTPRPLPPPPFLPVHRCMAIEYGMSKSSEASLNIDSDTMKLIDARSWDIPVIYSKFWFFFPSPPLWILAQKIVDCHLGFVSFSGFALGGERVEMPSLQTALPPELADNVLRVSVFSSFICFSFVVVKKLHHFMLVSFILIQLYYAVLVFSFFGNCSCWLFHCSPYWSLQLYRECLRRAKYIGHRVHPPFFLRLCWLYRF